MPKRGYLLVRKCRNTFQKPQYKPSDDAIPPSRIYLEYKSPSNFSMR